MQARWALTKKQRKKDEEGKGAGHTPTEKTIRDTPTPPIVTKAPPEPGWVREFLPGGTDEERTSVEKRFEKQPYTITESSWPGYTLLDKFHAGQNLVIKYNMECEFFKTVYEQLETVSPTNASEAENLKSLLDMFIAALLMTQAKYDPDMKIDNWADFQDQINNEMGMLLSSLVKTWRREYKEVPSNDNDISFKE